MAEPSQWPVDLAMRVCPVFRHLTGQPVPEEFPGFTPAQIALGLTVPACRPVVPAAEAA